MNLNSFSFSRQFEQAAFAGVCLPSSLACQAQVIVDCVIQGKVTAPSVRGTVVDPTGVHLPDTGVVLEANGHKVREARTDMNGNFNLNAPPGTYRFKVMHPQFTGVAIDLVVGRDLSDALSRSGLYVALGFPGSSCPMVWTNADKFHRMIYTNKK